MKKLLSIIIAVALLANSAFAAPSMVSGVGSAVEVEEQPFNEEQAFVETQEDSFTSSGPLAQAFVPSDIAEADSDEKPSNASVFSEGDAVLFMSIYDDGDGTKENPYIISDADQLQYFASSINSGLDTECYYKLGADIDLEGQEWTPVGYYSASTKYTCAFQGSFDGDGYTISNFKITTSDSRYIGFFGLVFNGEIKNLNLDGVTIDTERVNASVPEAYAGVLAGRVVSDAIGGQLTVDNCHVTNSSVYLHSDRHAYVGGLIGYVILGANSRTDITSSTADCDVSVSVNATDYYDPDNFINYAAAGGGLIGYAGAITDSILSIKKSASFGDVYAYSVGSKYTSPFAGGFVGQSATRMSNEVGGTMYISSCYATGNVTSDGSRNVYTGGFSANIGATYNMFIYDCYATGDAVGSTNGTKKETDYVGAGGFIGQIDFENYTDSKPKPIYNCYSSGDAIDTYWESGKSIDSYCGSFTGYAFAPIFRDCYGLESQTIIGKHPYVPQQVKILSDEEAKLAESYTTFDFGSVWTIDADADYPYPTLVAKDGSALFYNQGVFFAETYFGEDGKVSAPKNIPTKKSTQEYVYTFSHWSLTQDGEAFDFENSTVSQDTVFYAVFTFAKQVYTITFISEGLTFGTPLQLEYGSAVTAPDATPVKADTPRYRYEFDYWSLEPDGERVDFSTYTVTAKDEFYAVFIEIDKTAWEGGIATSFSDGFGTETLPYIITTAEEFALMENVINLGIDEYKDAYYQLGNNINLGYNTWIPIGTEENPFSAHFDGNGYTISRFRLSEGKYIGLFGYVENATIKNLAISDFTINLADYDTTDNIYAGGLVGYVSSKDSTTIIDSVYVKLATFEINTSSPYVYAGALAGYVNSRTRGKTLFTNCHAGGDIYVSANGDNSQAAAGGLFGYMYTYAFTLSKAANCYFDGSVAAYATAKCNAGGIAGIVFSYGSAYSPGVKPSGSLQNEDADKDIMLENCFASANVIVTSQLENSIAYAGAVIGELSQYAGVSNVFYKRGVTVISTGTVYTNDNIVSAPVTNLTTRTFLANTLGFDFTNIWTLIGSNTYPVLKIMYADKPILLIDNVEYDGSVLSANITSHARINSYTVTVAVYNERNQLLGSVRKNITDTSMTANFDVSFDGIKEASRIKVSIMNTRSFSPLLSPVEVIL